MSLTEIAWIQSTNGYDIKVDSEDVPLLSSYRWCVSKTKRHNKDEFDVATTINGKTIHLGRFLLGEPNGLVDHKNGDRLDNTKGNLRVTNNTQNCQNQKLTVKPGKTSKYKGVSWNKTVKKWQAEIQVNGKKIYLGQYSIEDDAALKYDEAAISYFGEFARTNLMKEISGVID